MDGNITMYVCATMAAARERERERERDGCEGGGMPTVAHQPHAARGAGGVGIFQSSIFSINSELLGSKLKESTKANEVEQG